ncbi:MAG: O-antigen translocase [Anaerolineales bacterium]|nr:O-antigen translocase [Anaerolineales bacterium]MDW8278731.1 O-antigen translocase [Anaerolineales bacterium]
MTTLHNRVIKSTTIIGGSSAVNILFRILQAKAAALLIGPAGVGLMGVYNSILALASMAAGMGLETSGVRQIAEAAGSGEEERVSRTICAFRRLALGLGVLGALILLAFSPLIAHLTFGDDARAPAIGFLSLALFCLVLASAQNTLIRGVRRIGDLAKTSIFGIALGTVLGLPLLYWFGLQGIPFYLIFTAALTLLVSWWYARRIPLAPVTLTWRQTWQEARELLSLGIAFMASGLVTLAVGYLVRVLVLRQLGLEAAGFYEAASALSNVYIGFILGAMGADYFPHLASLARDDPESNRLMNAQVEVGLLAAAPGILLVLALGPFLLELLYSREFAAAFEILRWQALGTFLRIYSWPLAYLMLARGKKTLYFWNELLTNLLYLGALTGLVNLVGLPGIGIAFFLMYVFYTLAVTLLARRLSGFGWSGQNLTQTAVLAPLVLLAFGLTYLLPPLWMAAAGILLALLTGLYALRCLYRLFGPDVFQAYLQRLRARLGWKTL